jgi:hypothetical protein
MLAKRVEKGAKIGPKTAFLGSLGGIFASIRPVFGGVEMLART